MSYLIYNSRIEFLDFAIHLYQKNLKAIRLDLKTPDDERKGNRNPAAVFFYPEKIEDQKNRSRWAKWKVHSDTMFAPLIEARKLIDEGIEFPFESGKTITGKGIRLNLIGSIKSPGLNIYKIK